MGQVGTKLRRVGVRDGYTAGGFAAISLWLLYACDVAADQTMPPARYRAPCPNMRVVYADAAGVAAACNGRPALGCMRDGTAYILRRNKTTEAETIKHECGHYNGWPADHPR